MGSIIVVIIPLAMGKGMGVLNRISLKHLFSWGSYKINHIQDRIGVFVSIVSTKIPFKGTGKEYIGDDITEISTAVKVGSFQFLCNSITKGLSKLTSIMSPVCYSAMLHPAKIQNSEEDAGT